MGELGNCPIERLTPDIAERLVGAAKNGRTIKQAAEFAEIPAGILRRWLEIGEEEWVKTGERTSPAADLFARYSKEHARYVGQLQDQLKSAGAGKESSPGSAGWLLERLEREDFGTSSKLEITGQDGGPLLVDGRPVVAIADVVAFIRSIGASERLGIDAGAPQRGLPPAREVLPDPPADQRSAERVPPE